MFGAFKSTSFSGWWRSISRSTSLWRGRGRAFAATRNTAGAGDASDAAEDAGDEDAAEKKPKKKPKAPAKPKTKTPKAAKPAARMRIVWVVMNDAFKTIATFDYANREAADTKAKEMIEKGKGTHFVQRSKEPMPDDAPGLGAAIP